MAALGLEERCRSHLSQARISAGVKAQLNDAAKVGNEAADDLSQLLQLTRRRVGEHQAAHVSLEAAASDGAASEKIQASHWSHLRPLPASCDSGPPYPRTHLQTREHTHTRTHTPRDNGALGITRP